MSLLNNLVNLYSMVGDWRVLREGSILFYWPKPLAPVLFSTVFLFLISFYRLVLWSGGLRTDMVYISLSQSCIAFLLIIIIIIIILILAAIVLAALVNIFFCSIGCIGRYWPAVLAALVEIGLQYWLQTLGMCDA